MLAPWPAAGYCAPQYAIISTLVEPHHYWSTRSTYVVSMGRAARINRGVSRGCSAVVLRVVFRWALTYFTRGYCIGLS